MKAASLAGRPRNWIVSSKRTDRLLRRRALDSATAALAEAGIVRRHVAGVDLFLDGPAAKGRDAVHVVFAGE